MKPITHWTPLLAVALTLTAASAARAEGESCEALKQRLDAVNKHVIAFDTREQRLRADIASYQKISDSLLKTAPDKLDSRILAYRNYISDQQNSQKAETDPEGTARRVEAARLSLQLLEQMKQGGGNNPVAGKIPQLKADLTALLQRKQEQLGDLPYRAANELRECQRQAGMETAQNPPGTYGAPGAGTDLERYPLGGDWDVRVRPDGPWQTGGVIYSNMARTRWHATLHLPDSATNSALRMTSPTTIESEWRNRDGTPITGLITNNGNVIRWSNGVVWRRSTGAVLTGH